jgi:hypothetical protein
MTRLLEEGSQDRTTRSQDRAARTGQAEQDIQDGQLERDNQNRTGRRRLIEHNRQNTVDRIRLAEQDYQDRTARTKVSGQDC